jgi:hypothetical protein
MKIPKLLKNIRPKTWLKSFWWLVLVSFLIYFLFPRICAIEKGNAQPFDIFLFLILISLLVIPLFQEVEFFGIKLKKELDNLKEGIDIKFQNLSAEIRNSISVNPIFNFHPPTDESLQNIEDSYRNAINSPDENMETTLEVPDNNIYLFKIRFEIEQELRRIIQKFKTGYEPIHAYNISIILSDLYSSQIITKEEVSALRDIIGICNFGIHNKPITPIQLDFVKDIGEKLIKKLKSY